VAFVCLGSWLSIMICGGWGICRRTKEENCEEKKTYEYGLCITINVVK
jgi:hypothetical protein